MRRLELAVASLDRVRVRASRELAKQPPVAADSASREEAAHRFSP